MARTVAAGMPKARPALAPMIGAVGRSESPASEAKEVPVEAEPLLDRSVFLYMEPRPAIDGPQYFAQCASCSSFIPETSMRGAVHGARCALFGASFTVTDDDTCGLYTPWPAGTPCSEIIEENAEAVVEGVRPAVSPFQAGYTSARVQCQRCRSFDPEHSECEMFECLTAALPKIWNLDVAVKPNACCNAWNPPPPIPLGDLIG